MPQFTVNVNRFDPYKNFKFRVKWDGRFVAGITKVSALRRTTEVIEHREGGGATTLEKLPGRTRYEPVTLERGVTRDRDFERWANTVPGIADTQTGVASGVPGDFRKDIRIELFDKAGKVVVAYDVFRCWVSEFDALDLDAHADVLAIERITLENEGWKRDVSVAEAASSTLAEVHRRA